MRAFPFRDWRRLEGFPSVPGFNPVWDYQPLLIERTREAGVQTIYVTDNPLFQGPRFEGVRAPAAPPPPPSPGDTLPTGLDQELLKSFARLTEATKRTFREGAKALARGEGRARLPRRDRPVRPDRRVRGAALLRRGPAGWRTTASGRPTAAGLAQLLRQGHRPRARGVREPRGGRGRRARAGCSTRSPTTRPCSCSATTASRSASTATWAAARPPRTGSPTRSRT